MYVVFSLNKITYGVVKKRRIEAIRRFYIAENQAHCLLITIYFHAGWSSGPRRRFFIIFESLLVLGDF